MICSTVAGETRRAVDLFPFPHGCLDTTGTKPHRHICFGAPDFNRTCPGRQGKWSSHSRRTEEFEVLMQWKRCQHSDGGRQAYQKEGQKLEGMEQALQPSHWTAQTSAVRKELRFSHVAFQSPFTTPSPVKGTA